MPETALILKLEGPMMSFGTVAVDEYRPSARHPLLSMVVGLLGNACGWKRQNVSDLNELQAKIELASRIDRAGHLERDYQTAALGDIGKDKGKPASLVNKSGWQARPVNMGSFDGLVLLDKEYRADASVTVAITTPGDDLVHRLAEAVKKPARPLFLGRKSLPPSRPIFEAMIECETVRDAIENYQIDAKTDGEWLSIQVPAAYVRDGEARKTRTVHDVKLWENDIHAGSREVLEYEFRKGQ